MKRRRQFYSAHPKAIKCKRNFKVLRFEMKFLYIELNLNFLLKI